MESSTKVSVKNIFGQQDTLQVFLGECKDYKCLRKMFGVRGTCNESVLFKTSVLTFTHGGEQHNSQLV